VCSSDLIADDLLFFCPYSEYAQAKPDLQISVKRAETGRKWQVTVATDKPIRLFEIEGNGRMIFSDDYFPLLPGYEKRIDVEILPAEENDAPELTIKVAGVDGERKVALD
jgi:hypothetical protein